MFENLIGPGDVVVEIRLPVGALGGGVDATVDEFKALEREIGAPEARLPDGVETRAGERGARLSGGERQRVALARAMLKPAALYLLDEATSALDPDSECEVMRRVVANRGGATLIVVAHRRTAFAGMDRVVEIAGGRFISAEPASDANADTEPPFRATNLQNPEARI